MGTLYGYAIATVEKKSKYLEKASKVAALKVVVAFREIERRHNSSIELVVDLED